MVEVINTGPESLIYEEGWSVRLYELVSRVRVVKWPFAAKGWATDGPRAEFARSVKGAVEATDEPEKFAPGSP